MSILRLFAAINISNSSPLKLFSGHPQHELWAFVSAPSIKGRFLSPQYCMILFNSGGIASLLISAYTEINITSGYSALSVFQRQATTSEDTKSGIGQTFSSGVASIAALGLIAEKICVPFGIERIFPPVDVHGSCKKTSRGELLQSTKHFDRLAMATCDLAKLICLNSINFIALLVFGNVCV